MSEGNGLPRTFTIGADDYRRLSLRDMIVASEAAGADVTELANLRGTAKIKALAAMAWVITRRTEPDLTYDEVLDGRIESPDEGAPPLAPVTGS